MVLDKLSKDDVYKVLFFIDRFSEFLRDIVSLRWLSLCFKFYFLLGNKICFDDGFWIFGFGDLLMIGLICVFILFLRVGCVIYKMGGIRWY